MRRASAGANVLGFPSVKLRPVKAVLRDPVRAGVQRLIALAPKLGRINPDALPVAEDVMRHLIGSGRGSKQGLN
jgi:hypothetical protein